MTRSEFLRLLAACGAGVGVGLWPRPAAAQEPPWPAGDGASTTDALVLGSLVIDGLVSPHRRVGLPRSAGEAKRLTGIDAGCFRVQSVDDLSAVGAFVDRYGEILMRIDATSDLEQARTSGRLGLIFYAERVWPLAGSLEPLARWHAAGLRVLQIADEGTNELGGGYDRDDVALTPFGRRVVAELNRLKIAIDVSHCGKRTTLDVAARSSRPVLARHGNAASLAPHERNKSDEELAAVARTGGVVAISILGRYLRRSEGATASLGDFVAQIDHAVQRLGIDHVGLCSDSLLDGEPVYAYDRSSSDLNSLRRWFHVAAALRAKGYADDALRQLLGLNFLRAYREALG